MIHVRPLSLLLVFFALSGLAEIPTGHASLLAAEVDPVEVVLPKDNAWVGQKVSFSIQVKAMGSFTGATNFSLPQVPRTLIVEIGSPVVSSETIGDDSWFIRTHEFAIFSQQAGTVSIPAIPVRYSSRNGFTGPAVDRDASTKAFTIQLKQPPGTEDVGVLITTDQYDVTEKWSVSGDTAVQGDLWKRTIHQQADAMTGMALSPPPTESIEGLKIYTGSPQTSDKTERGDFTGTRIDQLSYLFQKPGTVSIPAIEYVWWDPKKEKLLRKTLPQVNVHVTPAPSLLEEEEDQTASLPWLAIVAVTLLLLATFMGRRLLAKWIRRAWLTVYPEESRMTHRLLKACRSNDLESACHYWMQWSEMHDAGCGFPDSLEAAVTDMHRHRYGTPGQEAWSGKEVGAAVTEYRRRLKHPKESPPTSSLPSLN
ncbi:hypothetical protein FF011L_26150 [Roseimaritima multifibrata]|uniref:DUF7939 domain-containing protein n=1 Tax=Roseimaritima multifibrata TaxID=1930274 RepID=A0A517MG27_9BACT|nr:BatD family protein [Roseimaritima multifibrata]QDS93841.1 hypothetical protein FF011L_26150 [Roseimaritima multifibrata]